MSSKRRLSQNITTSANKLKLDSLNKILKIDSKQSKKHKRDATVRQVSRVALAELLKNAPTRYHEIPDFKSFLNDKDNVRVFREFLKTQYCHENIDFYLVCERYKQLDPQKVGQDLVKFMATQIFNDFLGPDARQQVNIDYKCFQNIDRQMKDPKTDLFCDAQMDVFNLMRSDCYPRFCKTWQIDRGTAEKMLTRHRPSREAPITPQQRSVLSPTIATPVSNGNITSLSLNTSSSQPRGIKRKAGTTEPSDQECPDSCPYYKVGLPCQLHNSDEIRIEHTGSSDLIDRIDFARIHHVPSCCTRRSPPPPPLPPRPRRMIRKPISPRLGKKFCPYVSEPFDV